MITCIMSDRGKNGNVQVPHCSWEKGPFDCKFKPGESFSSSTDDEEDFEGFSLSGKMFSNKLISCGICNDDVSKIEEHISCFRCTKTFHLRCSKFNRDVYSVAMKNNCLHDVHWLCSSCKSIKYQKCDSCNHSGKEDSYTFNEKTTSNDELLNLYMCIWIH